MTNTKNNSVEPIFDDAFKGDIDPFELFETWMALAIETEPNDPNAMALATLDADGMPDVRMVLLNGRDARGFVFYTNLDSDKARELRANQRAALLFHWKSQRRQVRIRGDVELVTDAEADAYFATRPRGSQIGAHASEQSRPLISRDELVARTKQVEKNLGDGDIPRPKNWSGFRVKPRQIEFWKDGAFRLHDRVRFTHAPSGAGWTRTRLNP